MNDYQGRSRRQYEDGFQAARLTWKLFIIVGIVGIVVGLLVG